MNIKNLAVFLSIFISFYAVAQTPDTSKVKSYPPVNENLLSNTKWKYTYTTHTESNTVIHRADRSYEYFLYLKYDYTLEHYLNGRFFKSNWKLNAAKNEIFYDFRQIKWWRIAEFTDKSLVLEFSMNEKSSYRYYFVKADDKETPFLRAPNELPDVNIDYFSDADNEKNGGKTLSKREQNRLARKERKKQKRSARMAEYAAKNQPKEYIKIELVGGGYYGGIDPIYSDFTTIDTDGRLLKETKTEKKGTVKIKKDIPREELDKFIEFVKSKNFFDWELYYNCTSYVCEKRLRQDPRPMPLRLVITYGSRRKMVTVSIYGKDERNVKYVDYPADLDLLVDAIQRWAYR